MRQRGWPVIYLFRVSLSAGCCSLGVAVSRPRERAPEPSVLYADAAKCMRCQRHS